MAEEDANDKPLLTEEEMLEYHTALYLLENALLEATKNTQSSVIEEYRKYSHFTQAKAKNLFKIVVNKLNLSIEKQQENNNKDQQIVIDLVRQVRQERKKYDKDYFKSCLDSDDQEKLDSLKEFIDTIKEDDPTYYNIALAQLFSCFKEIPKIESTKINQVMSEINYVLDDYQIEKAEGTEKTWSECKFDRILFNGFISLATEPGDSSKKMSFATMKKIAPERSEDCLNLLKKKYSNPDIPGYNNAQILLIMYEHTMKKYSLENHPFPFLHNVLYKRELGGDFKKQNWIFFQQPYLDKNKKPARDKNNNEILLPNEKFSSFFTLNHLERQRPIDEKGNKRNIRLGIKDTFKRQILNHQAIRNKLCDQIKAYFSDFCNTNGLNGNLVSAVFEAFMEASKEKYTTADNPSKTPQQAAYDNLYRLLFHQVLQDRSQNSKGNLFCLEVHHDRDRVSFSKNPNREDNFIISVNPNEALGFKAIYNRLLSALENLNGEYDLNHKYKINIPQERAILASKEIPIFDFHHRILHGADRKIQTLLAGTSPTCLHYFATPLVEDKKQRPVVIIDASSYITKEELGLLKFKPDERQ